MTGGTAQETAAQETLSAMLDDEAQELEVRRLLRDLSSEDQRRWERFNLARAALHREPLRPAQGFAASLGGRLDAEQQPQFTADRGWRQALGGFAVAASVAVAVIFAGQLYQQPGGSAIEAKPGVGALPVGVVNTVGTVPVQASFGGRRGQALQPAERTAYRELARQRLRRYGLEHAEHAALNTPEGMLPFGRVPVTVLAGGVASEADVSGVQPPPQSAVAQEPESSVSPQQ